MARVSSAKQSERRKFYVAAVLLLIVASVVGGIVWTTITNQETSLSDNLCPVSGPSGHVVLLVDKTDPLTFVQKRAVELLVARLQSGMLVKQGELLSVFVLGEDFRDTAEPVFEACNPGDGSDVSKWKGNPELVRKRFEKGFSQPLKSVIPQLEAQVAARRSPIFEMLQLVGLRFSKMNVRGSKRLLVVSDMLHNTTEISLYQSAIPSFEQLKNTARFARLRANLKDVDATLYLLVTNPQKQTRGFIKFWEDYFSEMGGHVSAVKVLPG